MGKLPPQAQTRGGESPLAVLIGVIFAFVLLGPPVGVIAYIAAMIAWDMGNFEIKSLLGIPLILLVGMPLSYLFGALPALYAGVIVGAWQAFRGRLVWPAAAAIGLGVGGVMGWFGQIEVDDFGPSPLPVAMATCCAATLVCWYIVRNFIGGRIEPQ